MLQPLKSFKNILSTQLLQSFTTTSNHTFEPQQTTQRKSPFKAQPQLTFALNLYNLIFQITMKHLNDLKQNFERVTASKIPTKIKKMLLQGILSELKNLSALTATYSPEASLSGHMKFDQTDTNYTAFSHLSLNSNDLSVNSRILPSNVGETASKQQLETQILQKQRMKIMLNEEIENYEDDYFHFQKILLTKKEYNEDLDNRISKKSYEISKKSCQKSATPATNEERKSLSYRFKSFFLM